MPALDLVKTLMADGVTFETDGERIRWRNAEGRITPEVVAEITAAKAEVIDFLTGKPRPAAPMMKPVASTRARDLRRDQTPDTVAMSDDAETYAEALRLHGPTSYGAIARILGWGATRAGQAEEAVRKAGRIAYDRTGMGRLIEKDDGQ